MVWQLILCQTIFKLQAKMNQNRIVEIIFSGIIILSYFLPLITLPYVERSISAIDALSHGNGVIAFVVFLPMVLNIINVCIKSANYPAISFFASIVPLFASLGIILLSSAKGAQVGMGTIFFLCSSLALFFMSSIRAAYGFKKHKVFLILLAFWFVISIITYALIINSNINDIVRILVSMPDTFKVSALFVLMTMLGCVLAVILIPTMGITILISALVRHKPSELISDDYSTSSPTARYCDVCGTKFNEHSNFCGNCGGQRIRTTQIEEVLPPVTIKPPAPPVIEPMPTTVNASSKPEWYKSPIPYIIGGVVAIVATLLIIFLPTNTTESETDAIIEQEQVQSLRCYKGKVTNAEIFMRLSVDGNVVDGEYYYTKVRKPIMITGTFSEGRYELLEYVDGKNTGQFDVSPNYDGGLSGTWKGGSKTFNVELLPTNEIYMIDEFAAMTTAEIVAAGKLLFAQKEYTNALKHFRRAAQESDNYARIKIGSMYEYGQGVEKDLSIAFDWFMSAAKEGYAEAEYYVGDMYEYGKGVTQNRSAAIEWYSKAAAQGNTGAQDRLNHLQAE